MVDFMSVCREAVPTPGRVGETDRRGGEIRRETRRVGGRGVSVRAVFGDDAGRVRVDRSRVGVRAGGFRRSGAAVPGAADHAAEVLTIFRSSRTASRRAGCSGWRLPDRAAWTATG